MRSIYSTVHRMTSILRTCKADGKHLQLDESSYRISVPILMRLISGDNTVLVSETDKQYIHESEKRGAFPPFSDEITTLSITKYPTIYTRRAIRHYYECRENGGDEYGKDKCFETLYSEKLIGIAVSLVFAMVCTLLAAIFFRKHETALKIFSAYNRELLWDYHSNGQYKNISSSHVIYCL